MNGKGLRNVYRHVHTLRHEGTVGKVVVRRPRARRPGSPSLKEWMREVAADDGDQLSSSARRWLGRKGARA